MNDPTYDLLGALKRAEQVKREDEEKQKALAEEQRLMRTSIPTVVFYQGAFYPAQFRPYYKRLDILNYPEENDITVEAVQMTDEQSRTFGHPPKPIPSHNYVTRKELNARF